MANHNGLNDEETRLKTPKTAAEATGSPSSKYVVYATACVYRELYWKINDRKKKLSK